MKPKKLYRYDSGHFLQHHEIGPECAPQLIEHKPHGTLWRCRHPSQDCYGYDKREGAEVEEIQESKKEIGRLSLWVEVLTGKRPGTKKRMESY